MAQLNQAILKHLAFARQQGLIPLYKKAAKKHGIPVEVLLAKDSRESWLGSFPGLAKNGWYGSDGKSKGISQINVEAFPEASLIDGSAHDWFIDKGAKLLKDELIRFGNMKNALSAYNTGATNVSRALNKGQDPDLYTTKKNYGEDVLNRAKVFKRELSSGTITKSILKGIPGFLILSAGGWFIKEQIDKNAKRRK